MERRELPQVGHVDRGAVSDQQLCHLVVTVRAGVVKGNQAAVKTKRDDIVIFTSLPTMCLFCHRYCDAPFVLGVHVGPVVQQVLHHRHSVVAGSKVKGGGVSSLQVSAVHILSRTQRLWRDADQSADQPKSLKNQIKSLRDVRGDTSRGFLSQQN